MHQYINQFSSRVVRDLVWVIASPPLVSGIIGDTVWWNNKVCRKEFNACLPALIKLDQNPRALIEHLGQLQSARLGSMFEGLISFWLKISPNYQLLAQNIQIIEEGITHGEIDFILRDLQSQKTIHLEVAVKFYLGSPPFEDPFRWFGTNTKDQLGKKLHHLQTNQSQLSKKYPNHFEYEIDARHCLIKGRLFYPSNVISAPAGIGITEDHLRGHWEYADHQQSDKRIIPIAKNKWLAEFNHQDISESIEKSIASTDLREISRAQCFVEIAEDNSLYREQERIFYLPNSFTFPVKT